MDKKTLKALKESILKWEQNTKAETPSDVSLGHSNCALCIRHTGINGRVECNECPVMRFTRIRGCINTPYQNALAAKNFWFDMYDITDMGLPYEVPSDAKQGWQEAAQLEVDFLKSLLPEGE